jgi:GNAT superfamily N-acetyltransferase
MTPVSLRHATPQDAEALGAIHVQCWREAYVGMVPDDVLAGLDPMEWAAMWRGALSRGVAVPLAMQQHAIAGFGCSGAQRDAALPHSGEIRALYVLRSAQRLGIGRTLVAAMARHLLAQGHPSATLWDSRRTCPRAASTRRWAAAWSPGGTRSTQASTLWKSRTAGTI